MAPHTRWLASLLLFWCPASLRAQTTLATLPGPPDTDLGSAVAGIGDLNGDGYPDVVVGMPRATTPNGSFTGRVRVYSGAYLLHGTQPDVLREWDGDPGQGVHFGETLAAGGDVDADGVPDVVVGATGDDQGGLSWDCGSVRVCSGATGAVLATFYGGGHKGMGVAVGFVGDVNGDGFDDVAGGENCFCVGPIFPGRITVWSGEWITRTAAGQTPLTPMVLQVHMGAAGGDHFGQAVAAFGDLDQDGAADFAVGAGQGGTLLGGYVTVYSGATGAVLATIQGQHAYDFFGSTLAPAGDVNGDGWPDLAIGAWGDDLGATGVNTNYGSVSVLSGEWVARTALGQTPLTPQFLLVVGGPQPGDGLGTAIAAIGDLDFDGRADLAIGASQNHSGPITGPGFVELVSGRSGALLWRKFGDVTGDGFGSAIAAAGDLDSNSVPDVLVGAPASQSGGSFSGMARVLGGYDEVGSPFCNALPNSTGLPASILGHGNSSVSANGLLLTVEHVQPHVTGIFIFGSGQTPFPAGNGILCLGGSTLHRLGARTADAAGRLAFELDLQGLPPSAPPILPGSSWNFEAYYRDPLAGGANFNFSNALAVAFVP
jgi:hypothetical protein